MVQTPDSITIKVKVDLDEKEMLEHLRAEWGTAGLIREALGLVPIGKVDVVLRAALMPRLLDCQRMPPDEQLYADEPLRPEYPPRAGQPTLDLLEDVSPERARLIGLLILAILLATIALLLVT